MQVQNTALAALKSNVNTIADDIAGEKNSASAEEWFTGMYDKVRDVSWDIAFNETDREMEVRAVKIQIGVGTSTITVTADWSGNAEVRGVKGEDTYTRLVNDVKDVYEMGEKMFDRLNK